MLLHGPKKREKYQKLLSWNIINKTFPWEKNQINIKLQKETQQVF